MLAFRPNLLLLLDALLGNESDLRLVDVSYVSRFARNLRTAVNARHDFRNAGASVLSCDQRMLSSDEDEWEAWARETVEAEAYSRRLSNRIREGRTRSRASLVRSG